MSTALRTKLRSLSTAHLFRNIRTFSSIDDSGGRSSNPPEPIPNRPLRRQSHPSPSSRHPKFNPIRENDNRSSIKGETDSDFLERFKLSFESKQEHPNPKSEMVNRTDLDGKSETAETASAPEDADEIFKKMKETGLIPNAVAMLDGLCKDGLVQEAMKLFGMMREKGTIPEVIVYTAVVEGFCKACKFDDAVRIFKKMQSNGVVPNVFSYQVLIRGLYSGKRLDDAHRFTLEALEAGHSPNLETFTGLVDAYCREKGLEEAKNVIGSMRERGFAFEEKPVREYLDKKGPFLPLVWEAILGKKASKMSMF
ncbi:pentatricopeptide repeat-containing protein At4g38150-like [Andrographis paniculata]|uniref:pentatricopeptide repeat-containing protein At4g38150-like n=1 Tax=Andrographis paniculata TaxID=175694 RepID=UPI0021E7CDDB|nr:pentatricopeptide repeat-containing protein At4g38150-like [Andrographis paniculata]XP_051130123.1 pentatricopeptide repeat-containing protein At4g38150-like [Andrographis paniculata]XP_051130124.1 pentatricopeptide repeat-containing protein At4g38150-like [Andrographis paniculata]